MKDEKELRMRHLIDLSERVTKKINADLYDDCGDYMLLSDNGKILYKMLIELEKHIDRSRKGI